ncbi:hypothetical protein F0562_021562 [Nyssa sinensis]|uniref:WRKY domain-containing protein n=1 Tax=Nyssa sinensis TaxID=561372 RepID=A0A5J5BPN5_9ASTE|nr:hypothetical protein F0562_021562 [Nyssa sinensis]
MPSSSGSLETSANSHPTAPPPTSSTFSFSKPFMNTSTYFSDLLASDHYPATTTTKAAVVSHGFSDRVAERTGSGIPKFKSIQPPSLPISPPAVSPSSYFSIPAGLSLAELLDSPVLHSASDILPSPTTGTIPAQSFNWKRNSNNDQQGVKQEDNNYSDFSFQLQSQTTTNPTEQEAWNSMVKSEFTSMQAFSPEISSIRTNSQSNNGFQSDYNNYNQSVIREQKKSDDGYNWRKYGQKQVKGSENPRSYYKCTFPNCPMKKKVERSFDGQITEIVYKGSHNHLKPQSTRRSSSSSSASSQVIQACNPPTNEIPNQSYASRGIGQMDSAENSSISLGDDDFEQSSHKTKSGGDDFDEDEPDAKRWKMEPENEGISAPGNRTVREPRVVLQTRSDIDILDDGYRWRKYGQKVVKGNPNPR